MIVACLAYLGRLAEATTLKFEEQMQNNAFLMLKGFEITLYLELDWIFWKNLMHAKVAAGGVVA